MCKSKNDKNYISLRIVDSQGQKISSTTIPCHRSKKKGSFSEDLTNFDASKYIDCSHLNNVSKAIDKLRELYG